jgi:hypothetical protein
VLDGQDIGMFAPADLLRLQDAYLRVCTLNNVAGDGEDGRRLARALIQLYRHGVRETEQLVAALSQQTAA